MEDFITAGQVILQIFGAIAIVGGGWHYITEWQKPKKTLAEKVKTMEDRLHNGNKRFDRIEETLNAQSILLIEISNHLITGNDKDALKEKANDLLKTITKGEKEE